MTEKGRCKHGEFILSEGCSLCVAERVGLPLIEFDEPVVITRAIPSGTALVKIKPETDILVNQFYKEALKAKEYAEARVIITVDDLAPATDDLSLIAKLKKAMEEKRKEYVSPLQDHVKTVNDAFKTLMEPIETADTVTRNKILAFTLKQKLIREEQEKINALRLEAAKLDAALHNGEISESVNLVEVMPSIPTTTRTDIGTSGIMTIRKYRVVNFAELPDQYKIENSALLNKVVKAGIPSIPGVEIYNEETLRVTTK